MADDVNQWVIEEARRRYDPPSREAWRGLYRRMEEVDGQHPLPATMATVMEYLDKVADISPERWEGYEPDED